MAGQEHAGTDVLDAPVWAGKPGPGMVAGLAAVELADLPDRDLAEVIGAYERLSAWVSGCQLAAMAEFAARKPEPDREFAGDQLGPLLGIGPGTASARVDLAGRLTGSSTSRLSGVLEGMLAGRVSLAKARILDQATADLDEDLAAAVTGSVLDQVPGWTCGKLRHHLDRAVLAADPGLAKRRAEQAEKDRNVWLRRGEHGNAGLQSLLCAYDAASAYAIIDAAARAAKTPGDDRNIGQIRADVLLDVVLGHPDPGQRNTGTTDNADGASAAAAAAGTAERNTNAARNTAAQKTGSGNTGAGRQSRGGSVPTLVNVMVPLSTLAALLFDPSEPPELDESRCATTDSAEVPVARGGSLSSGTSELPGWIDRAGPVAAAQVRDLIRDLLSADHPAHTRTGARTGEQSVRVGWRIVACDDQTGVPHALGYTRYRPPPALQDLVKIRDVVCRFPGCRQPASRCDIDHAIPFDEGGPTCDCNLHVLCRHHHRLKQQPAWTIRLQDGVSSWTTPAGHTYLSTPSPDWASPAASPAFTSSQPGWTGWSLEYGDFIQTTGEPAGDTIDQCTGEIIGEGAGEFPGPDTYTDPGYIIWLGGGKKPSTPNPPPATTSPWSTLSADPPF